MVNESEVFPTRAVSLPGGKELLERERERREELTYEQKLSLEHATVFSRYDAAVAAKLVGELQKIDRVTEAHAFKIADLAPTHPDDVKAIFAKDRYTPEKEEIDKIIDLVRAYL